MFFGVITRSTTWKSVGYLLLSFPLGIFYFVFLVTGFSLGFGLLITLMGIPILVGMIAASYGLGEFEREVSNQLLETSIAHTDRISLAEGFWAKLKELVVSSETWKRVFYLLLKFPFGIVGFVFVGVAFALFAINFADQQLAVCRFYDRITSGFRTSLIFEGELFDFLAFVADQS